MSKKQICIPSADMLMNINKALASLEKARKHARKIKKHEKRAMIALLEIEALMEDAKTCNCSSVKKNKKKKKKSAETNLENNRTVETSNGALHPVDKNHFVEETLTSHEEIETVTAEEISQPLLAITSLENTLSGPTDGKADELHLISGVGPKLEELLHGLGIYHFDQIANWTQAEIDWVDDYLQFSGRIERDNWIEQAKVLARGGRDEYVKIFGKEPR